MVPFGGIDAGWKPGGSKIGEKSSLLSDGYDTVDKNQVNSCVLNYLFGGS